MILQVATPNNISEKWRNFIKVTHTQHLGVVTRDILEYWWYVYFTQGTVAGMAGAKRETPTCMFIGPCVVLPNFRGVGIQREFIRVREELAKQTGCEEVVSYTDYNNLPSANNFIRCGYRLCRPWKPELESEGMYLYWKKVL